MKTYINYIKKLKIGQRIIHFSILAILIIVNIIWSWLLILEVIALLGFGLYTIIKNNDFKKQATGNGIIYGGRGKGKGLLLNKRINTDNNKKHYCNIHYNDKTEVIDIKDYIDSIKPLTTENFINNDINIIDKKIKYEGINIYWDDVGVYAPNFMDNQLKKYYPSLSALLPINRHLYNAHMIITTQDIQRPYKLLRELQTDFFIKAINSHGWGYIWESIPFLSMFNTVKYIYYEELNAAISGKLPFKALGLINAGLKHGVLTAGQATKEVYEAENGKIRFGRIWQLKKNINYDTRAFHKKVFGYRVNQKGEKI